MASESQFRCPVKNCNYTSQTTIGIMSGGGIKLDKLCSTATALI